MPYLLDGLIVAVIILCVWRGAKRGFIKAAFSILTFLIAAILSFMFYVPFSQYVINTPIGQNVSQSLNESVYKAVSGSSADNKTTLDANGNISNEIDAEGADKKSTNVVASTTDEIIKSMNIPTFMFNSVYEHSDFLVRTARITAAQAVSESLAQSFVKIMSGILLFLLILLGLWILRIVLEMLFKLPLLKEVNKFAGFIAGLVNGILIMYLILAIFSSLSGFGELSFIKNTAEQSYIYKNVYQTNILMSMFSK